MANIAGGYDASVTSSGAYGNHVRFSGIAGSGQPIDTWYDIYSGSFRDFTQGTAANEPTWEENVQNGLGAIQFDSANQHFLDRNAVIVGGNPGIIYLAMRTLDVAGDNSGWMRFGTDAFNNDHCTNAPGNGIYSGFGSTARKTLETGAGSAVRSWHLAELHSNGSGFSYYRNGALIFNTGTNTVAWEAVCSLALSITLYWGGYMGEVVIYQAIHNAAERAAVRDYFNAKWNLY